MKIPEAVNWRPTGRTLGSGGQGTVQVVTSRNGPNDKLYALKALRNTDSPQALARFRREIEVVRHLNHPAIVPVVDYSREDDGFQYYVMDFYEEAKPLHHLIDSSSNPYHGNVLKSLDLFEQIVSAVAACESADPKIVHRDIKPNNILVLPDKTIRLIDFGICQVDDGLTLTLTDENVGPRYYISPECESGNDAEIGTHSDLYSAAKVLWSAITSRRAFPRERPVFRNFSMETIFPEQHETWHLETIYEKTIRANPSDRFSSTSDLLAEIYELRILIHRGFPPLKDVGRRCPSCGRGSVGEFRQGYLVFGSSSPPGVQARMCSNCGFCFVRNVDIPMERIEHLDGLN